MAEWTITEMQPDGKGGYNASAEGEKFRWTSGSVSSPGVGARAAPVKPWPVPMKLRTSRTDYPGGVKVSEQVLGSNFEPFTCNGRWADKFNAEGYALSEAGRFEAMVQRGNVVRIQFGQHVFDGIITDFTPDYARDWDVRYSFTVSNHGRVAPLQQVTGTRQVLREGDLRFFDRTTPQQTYDEAALENAAIQAALSEMRAGALNGTLFGQTADFLDGINASIEGLGDIMDQRVLRPVTRPIQEFKRMATQFRILQGNCSAVVQSLSGVRSDTELAVGTALDVVNFEVWSRSLRFHNRLLMGKSHRSARAMDERDEPSALAIYEPYAGESLYSVSRRFYGTPFMANQIAARNGLSSFELTGDEELIIPTRGAG